jgi:alanine racemase
MTYRVVANINLNNLLHNVVRLRTYAPQSKILAMVKCNAYGHGAVEVARTIESKIDAFGVIFEEGLQLQNAGIKKPIVILNGFIDAEELKTIDALQFEIVVHNFEQIALLEKTALQHQIKIWLKIDTGMHRLGFQLSQVQQAYQRLLAIPKVAKPVKLMTHFSDADDASNSKTLIQIAHFQDCTQTLIGNTSLANSSAILNFAQTHSDWIRPGITLYGISPILGKVGSDFGLKPVMSLQSRIIAIHDLVRGDSVGYGSTWKCPEDMRVAIAAVGYGDGYPRSAKTGTPILVGGERTNIIGRVAMDMLNIDLRKLPHAKIGDTVTLWGAELPIEEVAVSANTVAYEIFCRLTNRVHFFYQK